MLGERNVIVPPSIASTLTRNAACAQRWDIGIIGAGVAGASLAIHLARQGRSVLLIESQRFPREKVCGGCLNQRAIALLDELGVLAECIEAGAIEIDALRIRQGLREHRWSIPRMLSIRRSTLDTLLVKEAIASGAHYLDQTFASIDPSNQVSSSEVLIQLRAVNTSNDELPSSLVLRNEKTAFELRVDVAAVAAGLTRSPLTRSRLSPSSPNLNLTNDATKAEAQSTLRDTWPARTEPHSRIGVQALIAAELLEDCDWSRILHSKTQDDLRMLIGQDGYLGISRTDGGFYDFAAALDPAAITRYRSIAGAIDHLLSECRLPSVGSLTVDGWKSTPHLTRRSWPVARNRIFLLGDSMGYVEPFTGEGMSWAMAGAKWLSKRLQDAPISSAKDEFSSQAIADVETAWNHWAGNQRRRHQSICRWVAGQVRHPTRTAWVLQGLAWIPPVRNILLRKATQ